MIIQLIARNVNVCNLKYKRVNNSEMPTKESKNLRQQRRRRIMNQKAWKCAVKCGYESTKSEIKEAQEKKQ